MPKKGHMARDCKSEESRACFMCNKKGHLAKDCKTKKGQSGVQLSLASSASEALKGLQRKGTRVFGGLGLQRVHAEGQGSLQGPRRFVQHRCGKCKRESNTNGR